MKRFARGLALALCILLTLVVCGPFLVPVHPYQGASPYDLADKDSKFIYVRGIWLHYKEYGQGKQLFLLLHGFGSSTFTWDRIAPNLARLGTVVSYDRPGFGLSQRPLKDSWPGYDPYDATEQAELAVDLIHAPQVQHLEPLLVRALVPRMQSLITTAWHDPAAMPPDVIPAYEKPLKATNWDAGLWYITAAPGTLDLWPRVDSVQQPTLVIHGDDDRIIPQAESRRLVSLNPRFTLVPLPNLGHVPQEEAPQTVLGVVLPWLAKTVPSLQPST
jgi:pimeloyl-ACP methyl ester carboxylesterase